MNAGLKFMSHVKMFGSFAVAAIAVSLSAHSSYAMKRASLLSKQSVAGLASQPLAPVTAPNVNTTRTPCPFLNSLLNAGAISSDEVEVESLVNAAKQFGIDESLMRTLANARADKSSLILKGLLDPARFPAHRGSLARGDEDLSVVDSERLAKLRDYGQDGKISFAQLVDYQQYCWSLSDMRLFKDKLPARAELLLLWDLFGAYRTQGQDDVEVIPVDLVHNFLYNNQLPKNLNANTETPTTRKGLIFNVICSLAHKR